jgi:hypothetical protein
MYVLVVIVLLVATNGVAPSTSTAEFGSQATCEAAAKIAQKQASYPAGGAGNSIALEIRANCFPK